MGLLALALPPDEGRAFSEGTVPLTVSPSDTWL